MTKTVAAMAAAVVAAMTAAMAVAMAAAAAGGGIGGGGGSSHNGEMVAVISTIKHNNIDDRTILGGSDIRMNIFEDITIVSALRDGELLVQELGDVLKLPVGDAHLKPDVCDNKETGYYYDGGYGENMRRGHGAWSWAYAIVF
eukprot:4675903-Pleurochrysis_carterae.AAC.3